MAWYEDLQSLSHPAILAVGWLELGREYRKGDVPERVAIALTELLVDPWQPMLTPGFHRCEFCRFSLGPVFVSVAGRSIRIGDRILYVPAGPKLYAAPSMILHYVDAHEYAPPAAFQDAVLRCPTMRSMEYLKAIERFVPFLKKLGPG